MTQLISYREGEQLAYMEYGDPKGFPILAQHGLIASIQDGGLFHRLIDAGARVICAARPGYGDSSPYAMRTLGEWGDLTAALVDRLELEQFDVLGMSSGAPYAYAVGRRFAERARNLYIFSGIPALYAEEVLALWPHPVDKTASLEALQALAFELFFANTTPEDAAAPYVRDSMRNHCFGLALDFKLRYLDWGFELRDVRQPVYMRHSREDLLPLAEITARLLPRCELLVEEGNVHFSPETLDSFFERVIEPRLPGR